MNFKKDDWVRVLSGYNKNFIGQIFNKTKDEQHFAIVKGSATVFQKPDNLVKIEEPSL